MINSAASQRMAAINLHWPISRHNAPFSVHHYLPKRRASVGHCHDIHLLHGGDYTESLDINKLNFGSLFAIGDSLWWRDKLSINKRQPTKLSGSYLSYL